MIEAVKGSSNSLPKLKARDNEVRKHEQAHFAAAGAYAQGGPKYEYQVGPDGKSYAVGGHVNIDVSPGKTPQETMFKAQIIKRAALAVSEPSDADKSVAQKADTMYQKASAEVNNSKSGQNGKKLNIIG